MRSKEVDGLIQDKSGRIFYGRQWLKTGCFANDDDDDYDEYGYESP
jgi:hypothetical protein